MNPKYRKALAEIKKNFRSDAQEEFAAMFDTSRSDSQAKFFEIILPVAEHMTKKMMIDLATNWFDANQRLIGEGNTMEDYYNLEIKGRHNKWVKQVLVEHKVYLLDLEASVLAWEDLKDIYEL